MHLIKPNNREIDPLNFGEVEIDRSKDIVDLLKWISHFEYESDYENDPDKIAEHKKNLFLLKEVYATILKDIDGYLNIIEEAVLFLDQEFRTEIDDEAYLFELGKDLGTLEVNLGVYYSGKGNEAKARELYNNALYHLLSSFSLNKYNQDVLIGLAIAIFELNEKSSLPDEHILEQIRSSLQFISDEDDKNVDIKKALAKLKLVLATHYSNKQKKNKNIKRLIEKYFEEAQSHALEVSVQEIKDDYDIGQALDLGLEVGGLEDEKDFDKDSKLYIYISGKYIEYLKSKGKHEKATKIYKKVLERMSASEVFTKALVSEIRRVFSEKIQSVSD